MNTDVQSQSAPFQRPQRAIRRGQLLNLNRTGAVIDVDAGALLV
jgi:hypothetical protein